MSNPFDFFEKIYCINLDNRKEFRRLIQALSDDPKAVAALKKELKAFNSFAVPDGEAG